MNNRVFARKKTPAHHSPDPEINDWSPGSYTPTAPVPKLQLPKAVTGQALVLRKVESALINCFLHENPPADHVAVVKDSLQEVDPNQKLWKAKVLTTIALPRLGLKQHISVVRFRVVCTPDRKGNPARDTYSIHHNYIIFPP